MRTTKKNINILLSIVFVVCFLPEARSQCDYTMEVPGVLDPQLLYHRRILRGNANLLGHYWQTSQTGIVRSEGNHAVHYYTVYEPGDYFVRRYSTSGNCWSPASAPVHVTIDYTPPLAVVTQARMQGYTIVAFMPEDKSIILQYADYYWVSNASPSAAIVSPFTNNGNEVNNRFSKSGTYYIRGRDRATETWGATLTLVVAVSDDNEMNWIQTTHYKNLSRSIFDPGDPVIAESRSYFDSKGQKVQDQTRRKSADKIMAEQPLVDRHNRVVGASLPAPISGTDFRFVENLLSDENGDPYDSEDFDAPGSDNAENTIYNPKAVGHTLEGTVGWYYSNNNTVESNVPKTDYPYSRIEFYDDGSGGGKRSASPGNKHRLGQGHEAWSCTFRVSNELDDYLKKRAIVFPGLGQPAGLKDNALQSGIRDQNGKYVVTLTDKGGHVVMTAKFGGANPGAYTVEVANKIVVSAANPLYAPSRRYFYLTHQQKLVTSGTEGAVCAVTNLETRVKYTDPQSDLPAGFYLLEPVGQGGQVEVTYKSHFAEVTYNFYDDAGRLCTTVSPNGTKTWAGFESPTSINPPPAPPSPAGQTQLYSSLDKTTYKYNFRGWLLEMNETDAGITRYTYRSDGNILFSQSALQREQGRFSYTLYDKLHRPVESGEYTGDGYAFDNLTAQVLIDEQDRVDWVKTTYDAREPNETIQYLPEAFIQNFTEGRVASSENVNAKSWYSYDDRGFIRWVAQKPAALDRTFLTEYTYDFVGNVLTEVNSSYDTEGRSDVFYHHFEYDADSRLYKSYTSLDGSKKKLRATYTYYLHGPVKRIVLGEDIQGIDFVYNIHGWLTQINHPDKSKDPGGDNNDVFGMVLDYYESDMNGIFSLGAKTNQTTDPRRFHNLPGTMDEESSPDLAYKPQPAYRQEMLGNMDRMKALVLEKNSKKHAPVTLADFRERMTLDDEAMESQAFVEEPAIFDVNDGTLGTQAMASTKPGLYEDAGIVDAVPDAVEFAALKAIFDNMGGTGWINKANWPTVWPASATAAQFGTWYGVTVTAGDITSINLSNNKLTGALVPEIGTLTQLVTLQLNANTITSIPPEIGLLNKVVTLYLYTNRLTAIPSAITGMSALKNLRLQANQIGGSIPAFLGSINTLTQLYLGSNLFTGGVPASFNALINLTLLDVSSNLLTGPLADLSALQSLTNFNAGDNDIIGNIPSHLGNLHALTILLLNGNAFNGPIPPEFNQLSNLTNMSLQGNALAGEIPDLSNLKKLIYLYLHSNQLEKIPATLGELSELQMLYLQENKLIGSIPPELGRLGNLRRMYLNSNQLTGEIPATLGELSKLENIDFSVNRLSGPLPPSLGNMTELLTLNLANNKLIGELPESWKGMTKLTSLMVGVNQLEGNIPPEYSALTQLTTFRVNQNRLSGEIPPSLFSTWTKLASLFLPENKFSGAFPSSIGSCPLFSYLDAHENNFTSLPQELVGLPLTYLNVQENQLKQIPNFASKANLALYVQLNFLNFANLESTFSAPNVHGIKIFGYNPQRAFTDPSRILVPAGQPLVIQAALRGNATTVHWEKKSGATWVNVDVDTEDNTTRQTFRISDPQASHVGVYRWTETSSLVTTLTLQSGQITVKLGDALPDPQSMQTGLYNGLISSVYWRTDQAFGVDEDEYTGVYRFEYDDKYQVKESRWGDPSKTTWKSFTDAGNKYRLVGMEYDPNGNIQKLRRYADDGFIKNDFTYRYDAAETRNRLTSVDNYTTAYGYDLIGRMTSEKKVEGDDHYVEYDVTGKVRKVFFDQQKTMPNVEYLYDDRGFRLAKKDFQNKVTTWYIRDVSGNIMSVYEQTGNQDDPLRPIEWISLSNITNANGTLALEAGYTSGLATASNQLQSGQDGYLEYLITDMYKTKTFGFSSTPGTIKYGVDFAATTATIVVRKAGAIQAGFSYAIGDRIRISREGAKLRFYKNGGAPQVELTIAATDAFTVYASLTAAASTIKMSDLVFKSTTEPSTDTQLVLKEIPIYGAGKLGTYYPREEGSMAYEITDHLGNVRALVRDHVNIYTATMEDSGEPNIDNPRIEEMQYFDNLFETEWEQPTMNHTPAEATTVEIPSRSAFLFWQDGGGPPPRGNETERSIGPAMGLKVNKGDLVDIETWARYERVLDGDDEEVAYTQNMPAAVLSQVLGMSLAYKAGFESLTLTQATNVLGAGLTMGGFGGVDELDEQDYPFAYLNYIIFDAENQFVDAGWQRVNSNAGFRPGEEGTRSHQRLSFSPIRIAEAGSVYIWVSNESENVKVWFDDLKVTHSTSLVVQATEYGTWGEVLREQKSEDRDYRFGYQGQFAERDEETGWSHFELREYDPIVARWLSRDPKRQYWSPYSGMGNNPVNGVDPDGGDRKPIDMCLECLGKGQMLDPVTVTDSPSGEGGLNRSVLEGTFDISHVLPDPLHDHFNESVAIEDFVLINQGILRDRLVQQRPNQSFTFFESQLGGPARSARYVRDPQNPDHVIDMRHMLFVAEKGAFFGNTVEIIQWFIPGNPSGLNEQDYYSNDLGYRFYKHLDNNHLDKNNMLFVNYLDQFLRTRTDPE